MVIFVFGNPDSPKDSSGIDLLPKLQKDFPKVNFQVVNPNEDLPLIDKTKSITIIDTVVGPKKIAVFTEKDIDRLSLGSRTSSHDYDLSLQLKLLKKLKFINKLTLIAIPPTPRNNYSSLHSIVKKLVAHDMQGS